MKKIIVPLLVIAAAGFAVYFAGLKKTSDPFSEALGLENAGKYQKALPFFITALKRATNTRAVPGKALAMQSSPEVWKNELNDYLAWLLSAKHAESNFSAIVDAIDRCSGHVESQNAFPEPVRKKPTLQEYRKVWNSIFYPEGKTPPDIQQSLVEKAMDNGLSILTLIGNPSYRYEGGLVNRTTGKRTEFQVYTDGSYSLLIPPGNYLFLVSSKALFPSGQVWVSPENALKLSVPDTASLLSVKLKTDIKRRS